MPNPSVFADNAYATLGASLTSTASSFTLTTGHGARFPAISTSTKGPSLYACLVNSNNVIEEIEITVHGTSSDTATIARAVGSTTAKAWAAGDRVEARVSKTALDNLAVVQTGTGAVARTVVSKLKDIYSAFDCGAVGDDSADDTTALQQAINNGNLYIPAGFTFLTTATINVPANRRIYGGGTIHNTASNIFTLDGVSNVEVDNVRFSGAVAYWAVHCDDTSAPSSDIVMRNCHCTEIQLFDNYTAQFSGGTWDDAHYDTVGNKPKRIKILNNTGVCTTAIAVSRYAIMMCFSERFVIEGNILSGYEYSIGTYAGVSNASATQTHRTRWGSIRGNTVSGAASATSAGIVVLSGSHISVVGNAVNAIGAEALDVENSDNIVFDGNTLDDVVLAFNEYSVNAYITWIGNIATLRDGAGSEAMHAGTQVAAGLLPYCGPMKFTKNTVKAPTSVLTGGAPFRPHNHTDLVIEDNYFENIRFRPSRKWNVLTLANNDFAWTVEPILDSLQGGDVITDAYFMILIGYGNATFGNLGVRVTVKNNRLWNRTAGAFANTVYGIYFAAHDNGPALIESSGNYMEATSAYLFGGNSASVRLFDIRDEKLNCSSATILNGTGGTMTGDLLAWRNVLDENGQDAVSSATFPANAPNLRQGSVVWNAAAVSGGTQPPMWIADNNYALQPLTNIP